MSRSRISHSIIVVTALGIALGGTALAGTAASVPEPTNLTLLALGFAGLVLGRRAARHRSDD